MRDYTPYSQRCTPVPKPHYAVKLVHRSIHGPIVIPKTQIRRSVSLSIVCRAGTSGKRPNQPRLTDPVNAIVRFHNFDGRSDAHFCVGRAWSSDDEAWKQKIPLSRVHNHCTRDWSRLRTSEALMFLIRCVVFRASMKCRGAVCATHVGTPQTPTAQQALGIRPLDGKPCPHFGFTQADPSGHLMTWTAHQGAGVVFGDPQSKSTRLAKATWSCPPATSGHSNKSAVWPTCCRSMIFVNGRGLGAARDFDTVVRMPRQA